MAEAPVTLPDDPTALKEMILQLQTDLRTHALVIQALRIQIARLKRQKFGASSEKIQREIAQLELVLEGLEIAQAAAHDSAIDAGADDSAQIGAGVPGEA